MKLLTTLLLAISLLGCVHLENSEKLDRACTFAAIISTIPVTSLVALVAGCFMAVDKIKEVEDDEEEECEDDDEECE